MARVLSVAVFGAALSSLPVSRSAEVPWTESVVISEDSPRPQDLIAYPPRGSNAPTNPPGFCWPVKEHARAYRLEVRRAGDKRVVTSTGPLDSTVFPSERPLPAGEYEWQVVYLNAQGAAFARSLIHRFRISADAPVLTMPDIPSLNRRSAGVHPRLFLTGERLELLRGAIGRGSVPAWERLRKAADDALLEPSYPEPAPYRQDSPADQEWLRTFTPAKIASAHLARLALCYRVTGERKYLEGARRWMAALAEWDPKGITSHNLKLPGGGTGNDEGSMPMLERMSLAWDWIGDQLRPEEREGVLGVMTERGNQVLRLLKQQDFLSHPFDNHSGRVIAFLGEAGIAFLGEIPEAESWLDYVIRCYLTSYPGWGGDEGGWSQGMSYWSFYVYGHVNFLVALRGFSGTDLFQRPFYRNTGYLPVYFQPAYAPQGGFGDGSYHPPSEVGGILTHSLADIFRDSVLSWQASTVARAGEKNTSRWREWVMEDLYETLLEGRNPDTPAKPPDMLDGSRYFPDIGWVAMHSNLGDPERDVWAAFKSSRYGSFSHSHADQNTFQLYAYGRALAIDSGYYPSYGTPHDNYWTRQTVAHNGVLINGRGQAVHRWEASGRIELFERHGLVTLVRGQAAEAYNVPQPDWIGRDWEKHLGKPAPSMDPGLKSFERTVAFVSARRRPILVVHDFLLADAPAVFTWLLHALNPMEPDESSGSVLIQDGDARVAVRLVSSVPYRFSQSTGFPIKPEYAANTAYVLGRESFTDQSHLSAISKQSARELKYLAVFVPYHASEPAPEISVVKSGNYVGYRVSGVEIRAWWGSGAQGPLKAGGTAGTGRFIISTSEEDKGQGVVAK